MPSTAPCMAGQVAKKPSRGRWTCLALGLLTVRTNLVNQCGRSQAGPGAFCQRPVSSHIEMTATHCHPSQVVPEFKPVIQLNSPAPLAGLAVSEDKSLLMI